MLYVIIIAAALFIGACLYDKFTNENNSSGDSSGGAYSSPPANTSDPDAGIPVSLIGTHPSSDSFWDTVDFYVRLANACYTINHNAYAISVCVHKDGQFSVDFFDMDSAKVLLPELDARDMVSHFDGVDKNGSALFSSLYGMKSTLENDAPGATVQVYDSYNVKSASIRWKGFYN